MPVVPDIFGVAWADLTADAVSRFLAQLDVEPEPLLWEAKGGGEQPNAGSVRKTGCGFANSERGGYLIVGAEGGKGNPWTLAGVTWLTDEPKSWLLQRLHELRPTPGCDAHVWDVGGGRSAAVVQVEPVTETPCSTPEGSIYQRLPGATVPIADPYVLAELFRKGLNARERATSVVAGAIPFSFDADDVQLYTLAGAPTGMSTDPVEDLYLAGSSQPEQLVTAVSIDVEAPGSERTIWPAEFQLRQVTLNRVVDPPSPLIAPPVRDGVRVTSEGALVLQRSLTSGFNREPPEPRGPRPMPLEQILGWYDAALRRARVLVRALGGHGDFRIEIQIHWEGRPVTNGTGGSTLLGQPPSSFSNRYWTSLADLETDPLVGRLRFDVLRSLGVRPESDAWLNAARAHALNGN